MPETYNQVMSDGREWWEMRSVVTVTRDGRGNVTPTSSVYFDFRGRTHLYAVYPGEVLETNTDPFDRLASIEVEYSPPRAIVRDAHWRRQTLIPIHATHVVFNEHDMEVLFENPRQAFRADEPTALGRDIVLLEALRRDIYQMDFDDF